VVRRREHTGAGCALSGRPFRIVPLEKTIGVPPGQSAGACAPANGDVLVIDRVGKRYESVIALADVSLRVRTGETVAIIGPSGSGKTTLLRCINFLVPYDSGRIYVNGQLVGYRERNGGLTRDSESNLNKVRKRIGMVFQKFNLFPHRSVVGNLVEGPIHVLGLSQEAAVARAHSALELVGLSDKKNVFPDQLSGGQQQRVGIARALCMEPALMLFDEVTSALDPELVNEVLGVMRTLAEKQMTMVVVTHEIGFARDVADRVVFMEAGKVSVDLPTDEFFSTPGNARITSFLQRHRAAAFGS
jgi:polar amino acid transport system ATP-binding protein